MQKYMTCPEHQDSECELLLLSPHSLKLLCSQCLFTYRTQFENIDVSQIVHLKQIKSNPHEFLQKILPKCVKNTLNYQEKVVALKSCLQKRLSEIEKLKEGLFQLESETEEKIQDLEQIVCEIDSGMKQSLDLDSLFQCFNDENTGFDEGHALIENSLSKSIKKLTEIYCKNYGQSLQQFEQKISQDDSELHAFDNFFGHLQNGLLKMVEDFDGYKKSLGQWQISQLVDYYYLSQLVTLVEHKLGREITKVSRLYLGTRQGFNLQSLLSSTQNRSQLMLIFKSLTGAIFGACTSCQWVKDRGFSSFVTHTTDDEVFSFLFSYTRKEIYPLKSNQRYACSINNQFGISFGGIKEGNKFKYLDLVIRPNFKSGFSQLGFAYDAKIPTDDVSTYLFGGQEPNIVEFEAFEFTSEKFIGLLK